MKKEETFNARHPEIRDGEMFLTNSLVKDCHLIGGSTKRTGLHAYTIYGDPLRGYVPVFVQKAEYDEGMKKYEEKGGQIEK